MARLCPHVARRRLQAVCSLHLAAMRRVIVSFSRFLGRWFEDRLIQLGFKGDRAAYRRGIPFLYLKVHASFFMMVSSGKHFTPILTQTSVCSQCEARKGPFGVLASHVRRRTNPSFSRVR